MVFYNIPPVTRACGSTNALYTSYIPIYILLFQCVIPVIIIVVFGYLTYRNIHSTIVFAEQHADRQFVRMTLIQVLLVVISMSPFGIYTVYSLITGRFTKDSDRLIKESFASTIFILISYFYYVVCYYSL